MTWMFWRGLFMERQEVNSIGQMVVLAPLWRLQMLLSIVRNFLSVLEKASARYV